MRISCSRSFCSNLKRLQDSHKLLYSMKTSQTTNKDLPGKLINFPFERSEMSRLSFKLNDTKTWTKAHVAISSPETLRFNYEESEAFAVNCLKSAG